MRERLRVLIRREFQSNREFARHCRIDAARVSEWLGGEQLPSLRQIRKIAERTGISLDWLVFGAEDTDPVYRTQTRTQNELERDLAIAVRREIHRREAKGEFDINGMHVEFSEESWWVDGRGIFKDTVEAEVSRVREWIRFEAETEALNSITDNIIESLRAIVPHLPEKDTDLGVMVYHLGRAAQEARGICFAVKPPKEPNSYRGLSGRLSMVPVVDSKQALKDVIADLRRKPPAVINPVQRRLESGEGAFAPAQTFGKH